MKNKLLVLCGLLLLLLFTPFINVLGAETDKEVVYFYNSEKHLSNTDLEALEANEIEITKIDIDYLDNMKYFYRYEAAYAIPNNVELPIIIAGDNYYPINNDLAAHLDEITADAANPLKDLTNVDVKILVYFFSPTCSNCNYLKNDTDVFDILDAAGVKIVRVDITNMDNLTLFQNYVDVYGYDKTTTPFMFAGSKYFHSAKVIENNLDDIIENAADPLLEVEFKQIDTSKYQGFLGFLLILAAGLIDGVNPCAIAMLILFISLLIGASSNRKTIIAVAGSYIFGLFLMYFITGLFLMKIVEVLGPFVTNLSFYINIFIIVFSLFFAFLNFYDFYVTKRQEYGKVKNQLPKRIQKFNKKLIKYFTENLNNKNIILICLFTFTLGAIISLTEFLCTGQVYLPIILTLAHSKHGLSGILLLLMYNFMFVLPLILITLIVIRTQSAMSASNFVREKMHIIKLVTSILFVCMAIYYILVVTGVI